MSLPLTDANGVVQATTSGAPVSWNAGLGYDVEGNLCVTSVASPADSYSGGRRVSAEGKLVISQSTPDGKPWNYNAGWPMDKNTGAIITQSGTPDPSEPRIAGVAVGPLGGIYMTEGGFTWSPEYLYLDGQVGAWYDPSDLTTMFTDAAGTTPVVQPGTVADQPVGLNLDKSQGLALGPELIVGAPDTLIGNWTDNGNGSYTGDGGSGYCSWTNLDETGSRQVTFTLVSCTGGVVAVAQGTPWTSTPGSYSCILAPGVDVAFYGSDFVGTINNISVKEIAGNHASQSTSTARPLLSARKNWLVGTETLATQSVTVLATQCVLSFYGTGTITLSGVSTAGPLVGTGAADRVSLTFTPTAGSLTLTVSGSVTQAQLEYVQ